MKISSVPVLSCLALLGCVSAHEGYLYTLDVYQRASSPEARTISSETAYSILARRLGISEQRRLGNVEDVILEQIDRYGGYQPPLFGSINAQAEPSKLVVAIEGYEGETFSSDPVPNLVVTDPREELAGDSISRGFVLGRGLHETPCTYNIMTKEGVRASYVFASRDSMCPGRSTLFTGAKDTAEEWTLSDIIQSLDLSHTSAVADTGSMSYLKLDFAEIHCKSGRRNKAIAGALRDLSSSLTVLASSGAQESTILLLPATLKSTASKSSLQARQSPEEEPLSIPFTKPSQVASHAHLSNISIPYFPPGTFLPTCFATNVSCALNTFNCSGHGGCYAKHAGCFACKCGSTLARYNEDGSFKTVQWGGAACQKKDVSVPFFLFAGFGIVMSAIIVGGIGMLYSMGAEELPSVLSAGVAGPRATR